MDAKSEQTIIWNDKDLNIEWPIDELNIEVSKKDKLGIIVKEHCLLNQDMILVLGKNGPAI